MRRIQFLQSQTLKTSPKTLLENMESYTVDETQQGPSCAQLVAVVGGSEQFAQLLANTIGGGSTAKKLNLENKYYTCSVDLLCFDSPSQLTKWDNSFKSQAEIGAVIVRYLPSSPASLLTDVARDAHIYQSNISLIVIDDEHSIDGALYDKIALWSNSHDFELVCLHPSQTTLEEFEGNNEKWGIDRIVEALHTVNWPKKVMKKDKGTGNPLTDRILAVFNELESDSEDEGLEPTNSDKDAIWTQFAEAPQVDLTKTTTKFEKEDKVDEESTSKPSLAERLSALSMTETTVIRGGETNSPGKEEVSLSESDFRSLMRSLPNMDFDYSQFPRIQELQAGIQKYGTNETERVEWAGNLALFIAQASFEDDE